MKKKYKLVTSLSILVLSTQSVVPPAVNAVSVNNTVQTIDDNKGEQGKTNSTTRTSSSNSKEPSDTVTSNTSPQKQTSQEDPLKGDDKTIGQTSTPSSSEDKMIDQPSTPSSSIEKTSSYKKEQEQTPSDTKKVTTTTELEDKEEKNLIGPKKTPTINLINVYQGFNNGTYLTFNRAPGLASQLYDGDIEARVAKMVAGVYNSYKGSSSMINGVLTDADWPSGASLDTYEILDGEKNGADISLGGSYGNGGLTSAEMLANWKKMSGGFEDFSLPTTGSLLFNKPSQALRYPTWEIGKDSYALDSTHTFRLNNVAFSLTVNSMSFGDNTSKYNGGDFGNDEVYTAKNVSTSAPNNSSGGVNGNGSWSVTRGKVNGSGSGIVTVVYDVWLFGKITAYKTPDIMGVRPTDGDYNVGGNSGYGKMFQLTVKYPKKFSAPLSESNVQKKNTSFNPGDSVGNADQYFSYAGAKVEWAGVKPNTAKPGSSQHVKIKVTDTSTGIYDIYDEIVTVEGSTVAVDLSTAGDAVTLTAPNIDLMQLAPSSYQWVFSNGHNSHGVLTPPIDVSWESSDGMEPFTAQFQGRYKDGSNVSSDIFVLIPTQFKFSSQDNTNHTIAIDGFLPNVPVDKDFVIPATVKRLNPSNNKVEEYTVTAINSYAFNGSSAFDSVTFPKTLKRIGASAFSTTTLKTIKYIPSDITLENNSFIQGNSSGAGRVENIVTDDPDEFAINNNASGGHAFMNYGSSNVKLWKDKIGTSTSSYATNTIFTNGVSQGESLSFTVNVNYSPNTYLRQKAVDVTNFKSATEIWQEWHSIQWYKDGQAISGQTSETLKLSNIQASNVGEYYATVDGIRVEGSKTIKVGINEQQFDGQSLELITEMNKSSAVDISTIGTALGKSNGGVNQHWNFILDKATDTYTIQSTDPMYRGKYLTDSNSSLSYETSVSDNAKWQVFFVGKSSDGVNLYEIANRGTDRRLDVFGNNSTADGTKIDTYKQNLENNQKWRLKQVGYVTDNNVQGFDSKTLQIITELNKKSVIDQDLSSETTVHLYDDVDHTNQQWNFIYDSKTDSYTIENGDTKYVGKYLSEKDGKNVYITSSITNDSRWKVVSTATADVYEIVNVASGHRLDIDGSQTANGTKIDTWARNNSNNQKWRFETVTSTQGVYIDTNTAKDINSGYKGTTSIKSVRWFMDGSTTEMVNESDPILHLTARTDLATHTYQAKVLLDNGVTWVSDIFVGIPQEYAFLNQDDTNHTITIKNAVTSYVIPKDFIIPATVKRLNPSNNKVEEYTVTAINSYAFNGSSAFDSVTFPKTLKRIGASAFSTTTLKTIKYIPSDITLENNSFIQGNSSGAGRVENIVTDDPDEFAINNNASGGHAFMNYGSSNVKLWKDKIGTSTSSYATNTTFNNEVSPGQPISFSIDVSYPLGTYLRQKAVDVTKFKSATEIWQEWQSIQWYKDGQAISGQTSPTLKLSSVTMSDAGIYYAEVDGKRVEDTKDIVINVDANVDKFDGKVLQLITELDQTSVIDKKKGNDDTVYLWTDVNHLNQEWKFSYDASTDSYTIENNDSSFQGKYLTDKNGVVLDSTLTDASRWKVVASGTSSKDGAPLYEIVNVASSRRLNVDGGSSTSGTAITAQVKDGKDKEKWRLEELIDVSAVAQTIKYGNAASTYDPKKFVKVLDEKGNETTNFDASFISFPDGLTGNSKDTVKVKVTPMNNTVGEVHEVDVPVTYDFGNSINLLGDGDHRVATFSLNDKGDAITATYDKNIGTAINSNFSSDTYYSFDYYDDASINTGSLENMGSGFSISATGGDSYDVLDNFGPKGDRHLSVGSGDIVKIYHKENGSREQNYVNNVSQGATGNPTTYYEITPQGFNKLNINALKPTSQEIPQNTSKAELDKNIAQYLDLSQYSTLEVVGFESYPVTTNVTNSAVGYIKVKETLKSGNAVYWSYKVSFKVTPFNNSDSDAPEPSDSSQWLNVEIPLNMEFHSANDSDPSLIESTGGTLKNNSGRPVQVELSGFTAKDLDGIGELKLEAGGTNGKEIDLLGVLNFASGIELVTLDSVDTQNTNFSGDSSVDLSISGKVDPKNQGSHQSSNNLQLKFTPLDKDGNPY